MWGSMLATLFLWRDFLGNFHSAIDFFKVDFFWGGFRLWVIGFIGVWWVGHWTFEGVFLNGFR